MRSLCAPIPHSARVLLHSMRANMPVRVTQHFLEHNIRLQIQTTLQIFAQAFYYSRTFGLHKLVGMHA